MSKLNLDDTIAAISTPIGEGGIGIVRLSGKKALSIADRIFVSKESKKPSQFETYTTHHGWIVNSHKSPVTSHQSKNNPQSFKDVIDEVILTVMRAPKSYTKEDIVEINCHSGIIPLREVLHLVLKLGARIAQPGEFTKRAFLNGRIDLAQAEAVLDVVKSKTEVSLRAAAHQLEGGLSNAIRRLKDEIVEVLAHIEAAIDFPDEDIEILSSAALLKKIRAVTGQLKKLSDTASCGIVLREGITTVICGRPNVGKSSLLNALLRQNRAIVTPIPGTTRDVIEEVVNIKGIPLKMVDTAGIIETSDLIAKEGISRSRLYLKRADLVLLVLDGSESISGGDGVMVEEVEKEKTMVVVNKIDLPQRIDLGQVRELLPERKVVCVSATQGTGLSSLEEAIVEMIWQGEAVASDGALITNIRHRDAMRRAFAATQKVVRSIEKGLSSELIAIDLKKAIDCLREISGETVTEDVLDKIFSEFCIGK